MLTLLNRLFHATIFDTTRKVLWIIEHATLDRRQKYHTLQIMVLILSSSAKNNVESDQVVYLVSKTLVRCCHKGIKIIFERAKYSKSPEHDNILKYIS